MGCPLSELWHQQPLHGYTPCLDITRRVKSEWFWQARKKKGAGRSGCNKSVVSDSDLSLVSDSDAVPA